MTDPDDARMDTVVHTNGTSNEKVVLLTGGGGVVGQALLKKLTRANVVCLVHKTPVQAPNATSVPGDLSLDRFGMSVDRYTQLAQTVDCVVHSAAVTDFARPEAEIMR